ncbi:13356_t:CDS:2, partial [Dentiscutata erythropus]
RVAIRHKMDRHNSGMYYAEGDTSNSDLDADPKPEPEALAPTPKAINENTSEIKDIYDLYGSADHAFRVHGGRNDSHRQYLRQLACRHKIGHASSVKHYGAEEQVGTTNQEVIRSYFAFGKKLEDRFEYYKKSNRDRKAKKKLINEVTEQLPNDLSRNAIEKKLERARKIYYLFSNIGYEKIQLVKSYSALRISKLSWDEIDAIEEKFE